MNAWLIDINHDKTVFVRIAHNFRAKQSVVLVTPRMFAMSEKLQREGVYGLDLSSFVAVCGTHISFFSQTANSLCFSNLDQSW